MGMSRASIPTHTYIPVVMGDSPHIPNICHSQQYKSLLAIRIPYILCIYLQYDRYMIHIYIQYNMYIYMDIIDDIHLLTISQLLCFDLSKAQLLSSEARPLELLCSGRLLNKRRLRGTSSRPPLEAQERVCCMWCIYIYIYVCVCMYCMSVCLSVCLYVCMCVCVCVCVCVSVCVCLCVYVCMCVCVCVYVCICVCVYVCMHACMHVCMYVCMHACMYVCVYVCVCLYACLSVCLFVCR